MAKIDIGRPTILRNHAARPRTVVIHAINTPTNLAAMMDAILFPVTAFRAPFGVAIGLADKGVSGIERLESRAIRIAVRPGLVGPAFDVMFSVAPLHPPGICLSPSVDCPLAEGNSAWVEVCIVEGPGVGDYHQEEEDEVQNENSGGGAILAQGSKQISGCNKQ